MQTMTEEERKRIQEDMVVRIVGVFDRIAEMVRRYDKPVIVGSELPAVSTAVAQQLNKALADKNYVCFSMPHEAASAFATLAHYGEYLRAANV